MGDYEAARGYCAESLHFARQLGLSYMESIVLVNLAAIAHLLGENDVAVAYARGAVEMGTASGARDAEAAAYLPLGLAATALGRWDVAQGALMRSCELFELNGGPHLALEPTAALARLCLAQGDRAGALAEVEKILRHLSAAGLLNGTEEPFRIRLSCYEVLDQSDDPRALDVLAEANAALQAQAARILDDGARNRFLHDVPHHRAIVTAWANHPTP